VDEAAVLGIGLALPRHVAREQADLVSVQAGMERGLEAGKELRIGEPCGGTSRRLYVPGPLNGPTARANRKTAAGLDDDDEGDDSDEDDDDDDEAGVVELVLLRLQKDLAWTGQWRF
jgi:hypothetical protein